MAKADTGSMSPTELAAHQQAGSDNFIGSLTDMMRSGELNDSNGWDAYMDLMNDSNNPNITQEQRQSMQDAWGFRYGVPVGGVDDQGMVINYPGSEKSVVDNLVPSPPPTGTPSQPALTTPPPTGGLTPRERTGTQPPAPGDGLIPGGTPPPTPAGPGEGLGDTDGPPYRDPNQYNYDEVAPPDRGTVNWLDLTFSGKDDLYGVENQPGLGGEYLYPGEFSPWGDPSMPGNNDDFYAKQFQRMLSNNLRWQDQNQATNPAGSPGYTPPTGTTPETPDWWNTGGAPGDAPPSGGAFQPGGAWEDWTKEDWEDAINRNPEAWEDALTPKPGQPVPLPTGPGGSGYMMNPNYDLRGKTNAEIVSSLSNILSKEEQALMNKAFQQDSDFANNTNWGSASGPEALKAKLQEGNLTGKRLELYQKILDNIYLPYSPGSTTGNPDIYAPPGGY